MGALCALEEVNMTFDLSNTLSNASPKYKALYEKHEHEFNVYILNYITSYYYNTQHNADKRKYKDYKVKYIFNRVWDNNWYCNFIASTAFRTYLQILENKRDVKDIFKYIFQVIKKRYNMCYDSKRWEKLDARNKKAKTKKQKLLKLQADARKQANKQIKTVLKAIKIVLNFHLKPSKHEVYLKVYEMLMQGNTEQKTALMLGYKSKNSMRNMIEGLKQWNIDVYEHFNYIRKTNKKRESRLTATDVNEALTKRYKESYTINKTSYQLKTLNTEIHKELKGIANDNDTTRQINKKIKEYIITYLAQLNIILEPTPRKKRHRLKKQEILNHLNKTNKQFVFFDLYVIIGDNIVKYRDNTGHIIDDGLDKIIKGLKNDKEFRTA